MLTGALRSRGICVGETKVGQVLKEIDPSAQKRRKSMAARSLNPKVYMRNEVDTKTVKIAIDNR